MGQQCYSVHKEGDDRLPELSQRRLGNHNFIGPQSLVTRHVGTEGPRAELSALPAEGGTLSIYDSTTDAAEKGSHTYGFSLRRAAL